ncbi:MAG TPA: hypothetical protein VNW72_11195 [Chthoniobacterales bacterium]|jgi:hypothetical protein|nr:hypothetical protein [Chthoniobacterales bacterium]
MGLFLGPGKLIAAAQKAHPAFRYAIAAAGIVSLVFVISRWGATGTTLIFGTILLVALMVVFLVFSVAAKASTQALSRPAMVLVWTVILLVSTVLVFLVSSAFFNEPLQLRDVIEGNFGVATAATVADESIRVREGPDHTTVVSPSTGVWEDTPEKIGRKIWQYECGGTKAGLVSWYEGDACPSMGIGHFLWYPAALIDRPDEGSFSKLLKFLASRNVPMPSWLSPEMKCPWWSRDAFMSDLSSPRMSELKNFLASTIGLQVEFMLAELKARLPSVWAAAPNKTRDHVRKEFNRLIESGPSSVCVVLDYLNFKGDGTDNQQTYKGKGWGLLQVLENMQKSNQETPVDDFIKAALKTLEDRVKNAPPERHEERWLPGWRSRIATYRQFVIT